MICSKCNRELPETEFHKSGYKPTRARRTDCKECRKKQRHEYYLKNSIKEAVYARKNYREKKEFIANTL